MRRVTLFRNEMLPSTTRISTRKSPLNPSSPAVAWLAAVKALDEPNREILIRRYYYDQKPRQIALALGLTVKQVDNSLYRSKCLLRQALAAE